jgi:thiosulfate dehydrogenase
MERSLNGHPLPPESRKMKALSAYTRWLSSGVPIGAKLLGAGILRVKEPARAGDRTHGALVYAQICAACHGSDGLGQRVNDEGGYQFPPLAGPDSFNNGAGMSRLFERTPTARTMTQMAGIGHGQTLLPMGPNGC